MPQNPLDYSQKLCNHLYMIKTNEYREATLDEIRELKICTDYDVLIGPNGFCCILGEIEDRTWSRDASKVVGELNRCMTNEEKYKKALEKIVALENITEIRGGFFDIETPDHLIKEGGWVPIPSQVKLGLEKAAQIAKEALLDQKQ